jgi:hypothetical protein
LGTRLARVEDAQAAVSEAEVSFDVNAGPVRSSMTERADHPLERPRIDRSPVEPEDAGYAAHGGVQVEALRVMRQTIQVHGLMIVARDQPSSAVRASAIR